MDSLPDELLLRIFSILTEDVEQLVQLQQVCCRFYRITQETTLWYKVFQNNYPVWSSQVECISKSRPLIDWKDFVLHIAKQNQRAKAFSLEFVPDETSIEQATRKVPQKRKHNADPLPHKPPTQRKRSLTPTSPPSSSSSSSIPVPSFPPIIQEEPVFERRSLEYPPPFRIQDPLVVDIDRVTKTGIVATGKHRREASSQRSEHKILFWEYPSWRLIREFDLNFAPAETSFQITGIQTIRMYTDYPNTQKVRLFSLAVGQPLIVNNHVEDIDSEDRVDLWQTVLIYRLFDNGATQCVAHLDMDGQLLGRDVFFFSEASWCRSNDGQDDDVPKESVKEWMKIVAPEYANFDASHTAFMLAIGPDFPHVSGCGRLLRFDIRGDQNILDPAMEPVMWNTQQRRFTPLSSKRTIMPRSHGPPAAVIARIPMGRKVSCMIHFRHPPQLNHLICTGSYVTDELAVYDWRFGVKVGTLPWKTQDDDQHPPPPPPPPDQLFDPDDEDDPIDDRQVVQPWGLEATMVLPPYWSNEQYPLLKEDFAKRGFRLIAVGDNRNDRLEIKVWDISYLLHVDWNPLEGAVEQDQEDHSSRFFWWKRGTPKLKQVARRMMNENEAMHSLFDAPRIPAATTTTNLIPLPYSPPKDKQSMILVHRFEKQEEDQDGMPVKYTAYNVLRTSLFLLTEEGRITVMDIETGEVIGNVNNVAEVPNLFGPQRQVRGIDVNVVGGNEIVVTSRQGLLRGAMVNR